MDVQAAAASSALHARARAFVNAFSAGAEPPEPFDVLACDVARFQVEHVSAYARLVHTRGLDPGRWTVAADAPAVPTDAFKVTRVSAFAPELTPTVFRTSGTTLGARGEHAFRDVRTYDLGAVAFGRWALLGGAAEAATMRTLLLGPSPTELPDSSLTHMLARFAEAFDPRDAAQPRWFVEDGVLDLMALDEALARALVADVPVLLAGTALAFVHLMEGVGDAGLRLPPGSRVMQTGGFKGRSREVEPTRFRQELAETFRVPQAQIVGEYGMTELSSQFYEGTLRGSPPGVYVEPPWARVVAVHPETLEPLPDGTPGIARIEDLLNVDSAMAVLTADRVCRVEGGFQLLGRAEGAPPRGCSIAVDEMLGG